jgi:hypothetical protein
MVNITRTDGVEKRRMLRRYLCRRLVVGSVYP